MHVQIFFGPKKDFDPKKIWSEKDFGLKDFRCKKICLKRPPDSIIDSRKQCLSSITFFKWFAIV